MAESIPKILTDDDLYGSIDQQSSRKEISEHFADVAEYLLNRNLIVIGEERYRITAVEFYLFNPQHTDFVSCLLLGNRHYDTWSLWEPLYAAVVLLVSKWHYNLDIYDRRTREYKLNERSIFGKAVITDVANIEDDVSVPIRELFTDKNVRYQRVQDYELSSVNMVRRTRVSDFAQFDDVYECVNRIRKGVRPGIYSREEIVESLMSFRNRRYRFERYVTEVSQVNESVK